MTQEDCVVAPSITWLNMSGDVTITWDAANRERVLALVREKFAQGYSFFIIEPRFFGLFGERKVALTGTGQLARARAVVLPDAQAQVLLAKLSDTALDALVRDGAAHLAQAPRTERDAPTRRARTPEEVLEHHSVAVRPVTGG